MFHLQRLRRRVAEDLVDPTEAGDGGREAAGRDGEEGHVSDLGGGVAGGERLTRVRPHGSLGERAHCQRHLDETLRTVVERTCLFSRPPKFVESLCDLRMGIAEGQVDLRQMRSMVLQSTSHPADPADPGIRGSGDQS